MACDPLRDLRTWQERLERLATHQASPWAPSVDVYETDDRYVISAEIPGLARDQIQLSVQDNRLTIRGERPAGVPESTTRHYHQVERGHGAFYRTFEFTESVRHDAIRADLRDGVLTVTLPKLAAPPRRIDVQ
jgi:HSP20 family protein